MARTKSLKKIEEEEREFLEKLQMKNGLGFAPALAMLLYYSENFPKTIKPQQYCEAYCDLPGEEKDLFFQKLVSLCKDLEFWRECRSNATKLGNGKLYLMCTKQMLEFTTTLKELSNIYNTTRDEEIRAMALKKMKTLVKEQPKKV